MLKVMFWFTCKFPTLLTPGLYIKNLFKEYSEVETSTLCFGWTNYSCIAINLKVTLSCWFVASLGLASPAIGWDGPKPTSCA